MACKTKKLKLRKYSKGSTLPKAQTGMELSYADQSSEIFTPNSNQYNSLGSYNQYQNTQQYGPGLNAQSGDFIQSDVNNQSNTGNINASGLTSGNNLSTYGAIAQIAGSLTEGMGTEDYEAQFGEHSSITADIGSQIGPIGALASGVGELGGNMLKSQIDYDEYGNPGSEDWHNAYYVAGSFFDPAGSAEYWLNEGDTGKAIQSFLLPGLGGMNIAENERELAKEREAEAKKAKYDALNTAKRKELESNTITYGGLAKYGGRLRKYQNGGGVPIGTDPNTGKTIYSKSTPSKQTAYAYDNIVRPVTQQTAQLNALNDLGISKEDFYNNLSNEYLDSLVGVYRDKYLVGEVPYQVQRAKDSTGNLTLNMLVPDKRTKQKYGGNLDYMNPSNNNRPTVFKYTGQTHNGADEGIEVDSTGIPSIMSGKAPVALTEKGEVAFKAPDMESAYIFSDSIKYKK